MIPLFPQFKLLEFSDKKEIDEITSKFPPYSDFNFLSLWSWNTRNEILISKLHSNLIVRFTDYVNKEPFYSFLGDSKTVETAEKLINFCKENNIPQELRLLPEISVKDISNLSQKNFHIQEDLDHHDYIYSTEALTFLQGSDLKNHRNMIKNFQKNYGEHEVITLDLVNNKRDREDIFKLYEKWENNSELSVPNEKDAFIRFLELQKETNIFSTGIVINNSLVAFDIHEKIHRKYTNCLFSKADTSIKGIYSFLMHSTSKLLSPEFEYINFEQDLGIENLRKAKKSFSPIHYLKKYSLKKI